MVLPRTGSLEFGSLYIRMEISAIKTAKSTYDEYFELSMIKISARSDEVKWKLSVVQSCDSDENQFSRKIRNTFGISLNFLKIFLWTTFHGESTEDIEQVF